MRIPMLLRKNNIKLAKLIPFFVLVLGFFVFKGVLAANYWVTDPADCPSTSQTYYPGQNCDNLDICGTLSGNVAQCYDTSGIATPSVTGTSDTIYTGSLPSGYILDCFATDSSVNGGYCSNNGDWWCNASSTCSDLNRETDCAANQAGVATCGGCSADAHACDGSFVDADGCEIQDGATCVSSDGLIGVYDNCNGAEGFCKINSSYFQTGVNVRYATSSSLLWGTQYGSGNLMELSASNTPGGIFTITNDGRVGIGTSTLGANNMLTVGLDAGSQFIVSKSGVVTGGSWQAGIIGLAYGGTGLDFSTSTGFLYLSNGTSTATTTIYIGNTDLAVANSGGSTLLSYVGNTITLDTAGNWMGTVEGIDISSASSTWDATTNTVNTNSGNWTSAYNAVNASSSSWTMAYDAITASSTYWNTAYNNRIISTGGNITFTGNTIGVATGYNIPLTASTTNWNNTYNTVNTNSWLADADFATNGLMVRTANGTYVTRIATGTANQIIAINGDGVGGNPTFSLDSAVYLGTSGKIGRDADNLVDFSIDNQVTWRTNATDRMVLNSSGYLGIGTTTPSNALTVLSTTGAQLRLAYDADNYAEFTVDNTGQLSISSNEFQSTLFGSGDEAFRIDSAGNVIIGTTTASAKLTLWGTAGTDLLNIASSTGDSAFIVKQDGNIGIGTSSPVAKLDIWGNLNVATGTIPALQVDAATNRVAIGKVLDEWSATLEVGGYLAVQNQISFRGAWSQFQAVDAGTDLEFKTAAGSGAILFTVNGSTNALTAYQNGNIGIGTTTPSQMLTVGATSSQQFLVNNIGQVVGGTWMGNAITNTYIASSSIWNTTTATVDASSSSWTLAYNTIVASSTDWQTAYTNRITAAGAGLLITGNTISADTGYMIPTVASTTAWNSIAASSWSANGSSIYYNSGNVGIGTTTPAYKLSINGGSGENLFQVATSTNAGIFTINANGNVGIGTVNPDRNLDVESSGATFVSIVGGVSNNVGLLMGTSSSDAQGRVQYDNSVNALSLWSNHYERLTINSSGNVGIGTTNPMAKVHAAGITPLLMSTSDLVWGTTGSVAQFEFGAASGNTYTKLETFINGGSGYGNLVINPGGGNVGIGTTTPSAVLGTDTALVVAGSQGPSIVINDTGQASPYSIIADGSNLSFAFGSNRLMVVNSGGNIGVGTTNPGYKLDVNGSFNATSVYSNGVLLSPGTGSNWSVNGANIYRSAGNVGIGTSTPGALLTLENATPAININATTAGKAKITLSSLGVAKGLLALSGQFEGDSTTDMALVAETGQQLRFYTNGSASEVMTISASGSVIIGTTSPGTYKLLVSQDTTNAWAGIFQNTDAADSYGLTVRAGNDSNDAAFSVKDRTAVNNYLYVRGDGNIGIGTSSPGQKLTVLGGDIALRADNDLTNAVAMTAGSTEGYIYVNNAGSSKVFLSAHSSYDSYFNDNLAIGATDSGTAKLHVNGNVGIGTTDPLASLQISGGYNTGPAFTNTAQLRIVGTGSASTGNDAVIRFDTPSNSRLIYVDESDSNKMKFTGGAGTDLFTIDNVGNIGMGTTSPGTTKLRVTQTTTNAWASFIENTDAADSYGLTVRAGNDSADASFSVMNRTSGSTYLHVRGDGYVGIGTAGPGYILDVQHASSKVNSKNGYLTNGADYAEYFYTNDTDLASGETVCIDVAKDNTVMRCVRGADNNVMGIVSTNPSIVGNGNGVARDNDPHYKIIGMLGQVPALVTNDNGPINPGDSLTSASTTPGFLMRANAGDSTVGIALESFDSSAGRINVLISRRNKSLTVETVEAEVSKRIADMAIEDDVRSMISDSLASLNVDDQIKAVVANELNIFDSRLTLKFDDVSGQITNLETKYTDLDARLARVENNFTLMNDELDQASTTMAQLQKSLELLSEKTITSVEIFDPFQDASTTVLIADIIASHEVEILNLQNEVIENKSSITTLESKVLTIEDRMALLENANSEATSTVLSESTATNDSIFDIVMTKLNLFGVYVSDKIIGVKNLIADLIDTREIKITQNDNTSDNIIGEGIIPAGATSTVIISNKIATSSKIFITFRSDYGSRWWIGDQTTGTSTVVIAEPLTADIYFDWWVIGVNPVVPIVTATEEVVPIVDISDPIEAIIEPEIATTTEVTPVEEVATTTISDLVDNIETVATTTE